MKNNSQNIAIVMLTISAMILGAMVLCTVTTDNAQAASPSITYGYYTIGTGLGSTNVDLIYIINNQTNVLNVYGPTHQAKWDILCTVDIKQAFSMLAGVPDKKNP